MKPVRNRGLSLLEVLLSLVLLIGLVLILVVYTQKLDQRKTISIAKQEINAILNAAVQYKMAYSQWPSNLNQLLPLLSTAKISSSFCSPWQSGLGCAIYSVTFPVNNPYFGVQVTTPSVTIAQNLESALPTAYISGTTIIAYTTAATASIKTQVPTGFLYASPASSTLYYNSSVNDNCAMSNPEIADKNWNWARKNSGKGNIINPYCSIFFEQQPPAGSSTGPYGFVLPSSPSSNFTKYTITNQHISYAPLQGTTSVFIDAINGGYDAPTLNQFSQPQNIPSCPSGSSPTLLFLPTSALFIDSSGGGVFSAWNFSSFSAHISVRPGAGPKNAVLMGCINSRISNYVFPMSGGVQMAQVDVSSVSDIVCIPDIQLSHWPDHNQADPGNGNGYVCPVSLGSILTQ